MKWYAITLLGADTLNFVCPGLDSSEALSLARRDCSGLADFRSVHCAELQGDEAAAMMDLASGHLEAAEGLPAMDNATDAECVWDCLKKAGVNPSDLALALAKLRNPDVESLEGVEVARPSADVVAANALEGGEDMLVDHADELLPAAQVGDDADAGAAAMADAKADAKKESDKETAKHSGDKSKKDSKKK